MEIINDESKLDFYIKKYNIEKIFTDFSQYRKYMQLVKFNRGEYIYSRKDDIYNLYFFIHGRTKVITTLSNGKSHLLYIYSKFELLGDLELFNKSNPYVTIQAVHDSYCISLMLAYTKEKLFKDTTFLRWISEYLSTKLCHASSNSSLNLLYPLENRLCAYINASMEAVVRDGVKVLIFKINLQETADILSTSYRHLERTLSSLSEKGILQKEKKNYLITDIAKLKELSSDLYL